MLILKVSVIYFHFTKNNYKTDSLIICKKYVCMFESVNYLNKNIKIVNCKSN